MIVSLHKHKWYLLFFLLGATSVLGVIYFKRNVDFPFANKKPQISINTTDRARAPWETVSRQSILKAATLEGATIRLPGGVQQIPETIIIPKGYVVYVPDGARYKFAPEASLVTYSPIRAAGGEQGIVFSAANDARPFGVIAIIDAEGPSSFQNVSVRGASEMTIDGVYVSGAVSLLRSEGVFSHVTIEGNTGEDGINVQHASTTIEGSSFLGNAHDGLDLDNVTAILRDNHFENNGSDGLDVGSSTVDLTGNTFKNHGRCMEIGESSEVYWDRNTFVDCQEKFSIDTDSQIHLKAGSTL